MNKLTTNELNNINGGSALAWGFAIISGIIAISGIFSGFTNPSSCND